jgi:hypothetical protein
MIASTTSRQPCQTSHSQAINTTNPPTTTPSPSMIDKSLPFLATLLVGEGVAPVLVDEVGEA